MTIDTMIRLFDLIQDKTNSPYFTDSEKLDFINRAERIFLSEYMENNFPGELGSSERGFISARGLENNQGNTDIITPLIVGNMRDLNITGDPIRTGSDGKLSLVDIETAISFNSGQSTPMMKLLSMGRIDGVNTYPIKFVRHNDYLKFLNNSFLSPTNLEPIFTNDGSGYIVFPNQVTDIEVSVIREPVSMVFISDGNSSNVSSELSDDTHDRILDTALNLAGISTRDVPLVQLQEILHKQDRR